MNKHVMLYICYLSNDRIWVNQDIYLVLNWALYITFWVLISPETKEKKGKGQTYTCCRKAVLTSSSLTTGFATGSDSDAFIVGSSMTLCKFSPLSSSFMSCSSCSTNEGIKDVAVSNGDGDSSGGTCCWDVGSDGRGLTTGLGRVNPSGVKFS